MAFLPIDLEGGVLTLSLHRPYFFLRFLKEAWQELLIGEIGIQRTRFHVFRRKLGKELFPCQIDIRGTSI